MFVFARWQHTTDDLAATCYCMFRLKVLLSESHSGTPIWQS